MKQYLTLAALGAAYIALTRLLEADDLAEVALLVAMAAAWRSWS